MGSEVTRKYLNWVKAQPCCACGMPADDPHHITGVGMGGVGLKASPDILAIPLCRQHHNLVHQDRARFESLYGSQMLFSLKTIVRALEEGSICLS